MSALAKQLKGRFKEQVMQMATRADLVSVGRRFEGRSQHDHFNDYDHFNGIDHAELAMQAANKLRRARRQSQKEKMGQAVCHHLLRMLDKESEPTAREKRLAASRAGNVPAGAPRTDAMPRPDDSQLSMSF